MPDIANKLEADADKIVETLKRKWIEHQSLLLLSADEPLFVHIDAFAAPAYADVLNNYPVCAKHRQAFSGRCSSSRYLRAVRIRPPR